jgi:Zn-dependent protease
MNFWVALVMLPGLVIGLTLHEFAHAWSASLLGDDFPRRQGRVSLNPFRHLSPLGTLAIFLLPFGWGRPVLVNLYNFRRPKRDYLLTSLAGPAANVLAVGLCLGLMQLTRHCYRYGPHLEPLLSLSHYLLALAAIINVVLATFNLLPIPPLDGSKIWPCLIPGLRPAFGRKTLRVFLLVLLALLWTNSLDPLAEFVLNRAQSLMPVLDQEVFRQRYDAGMEAYHRRQFQLADEEFTQALAVNPWGHECYYWRAAARAAQEDAEGAVADMGSAIALAPATPQYYEYRAELLENLGRSEQANADRLRALALRSATAPATSPATLPASRLGGRGRHPEPT